MINRLYKFNIRISKNKLLAVIILPFGKWNVRKIVEAGKKKEWLRHVDQMFALAYEDMYKINDVAEPGATPISQCVIIVDFDGFGIRQLTSILSN